MRRCFAVMLVLLVLMAGCAVAGESSIVIGIASDALFMDPAQQDETITNTMVKP